MDHDEKSASTTKLNAHRAKLFKTISSDEFSDQYDIKKIVLGLKKHMYLIVICGVLFGILGVYATFQLLKTYKAEAILVFDEDQRVPEEIPGGYSLATPTLATSVDMIMSTKNLEAVRSILGLDLNIIELASMINIPPAKLDSRLRRIEVKSMNPHLAVDIANVLAKVVVKSGQEFKREQLNLALNNYRSQLAIANLSLNKLNAQIEEFKKEHQYFETEATFSIALSDIDNARKLLSNVTINYQSTLIEYENLKKEAQLIPDMVPINREGRESPYKTRIITLEAALAQAKSKYTPENPKIKAIQEELDELLKKMTGSSDPNGKDEFLEKNPLKETIGLELMHLQGKVQSALNAKEELTKRVAELEKLLQNIPEQQVFLGRLLQAKQLVDDQVKFLSNAVESTQLLVNSPKGNVELFESAKEAGPSNDKWWVNFLSAIALIFGFGVGAFFAAVLEIADGYLRTAKQISINYTIPCLLTIPEIPLLNNENGEKKSLFFIRELAEKIENMTTKGQSYSILFTSSRENEGKSFLSFYLAKYYKKINKKVLILDFDVSYNSFCVAPTYSLNELMENPSLIKDDIEHIRLNDNHTSLKNVLSSATFDKFWKTLKSQFDVLIIETPGIINDSFAVNFSTLTDILLFVIASSYNEKNSVDESLHVLESYRVIPSGIILNRVDPVYIDNERIRKEMKRNEY